MNTNALDLAEIEAMNRLRKVWVPTKVVLEAIFAWLDQAKTMERAEDGLLALRWCKWQRIKCLHDASTQSIFDDQYQRGYRSLTGRALVDERVSNTVFEISESDLSELPRDVQAMEKFLANYLPPDDTIDDVRNACTSYCERHLWGPFTDDGAGTQIHFWPVQDCFKASEKK